MVALSALALACGKSDGGGAAAGRAGNGGASAQGGDNQGESTAGHGAHAGLGALGGAASGAAAGSGGSAGFGGSARFGGSASVGGAAAGGSSGQTGGGSGGAPVVERLACNLFTALERYIVLEKDFTHDRCLRLTVTWGLGTGPFSGVTVTDGWEIESIFLTDSAADCAPFDSNPSPVAASAATGSLDLAMPEDGGFLVPFISANLRISFPPGESWVPSNYDLTFADLPTQTSACP